MALAGIAQCPKLNNFTENPSILTIDNMNEPRLNTYQRTVGVVVNLRCSRPGLNLTPNNPVLRCLSNKTWSGTIPVCKVNPTPTTPVPTTPAPTLSQEQVTIIGITGGVGGLILIILICLIVCICIMQSRTRRTRREDKKRIRPAGTDVTSVTTLYPAESRAIGGYSGYPSYTSPEAYPGYARQNYHSMALPPATPGYDVYNNPSFRVDADNLNVTSSARNDLLDVIARERMNQMVYEKERFRSLEHPRPDYNAAEGFKAHGKRLPKRGPRSPEAVTRAQRTLQYVEEHSSGSPEPPYFRDQGRYDDRSTTYRDGFRSLDRYIDDSRSRGRYTDNYSQHRYFSNPVDVSQDYLGFHDNRGNYNIPRGYDRYDLSGQGSQSGPELESSASHWRPDTRTHYTSNRYR